MFLLIFNKIIRIKFIRKLLLKLLKENPDLAISAVANLASPQTIVPNKIKIEDLPQKIENLEDLYWLFFNHYGNRGLMKLDIDEACYIFSLIRKKKPKVIFEIGTYMGGGTILIACAKDKSSRLYSIDLKVKHAEHYSDENIKKLICLVDKKNTYLIKGDSKEYIPAEKIDFLFIDGDHSYEGVKADFEHYLSYLNNGADILFHDAVAARPHVTCHQTIYKFVKEIENSPNLELIRGIGSIRHYKFRVL